MDHLLQAMERAGLPEESARWRRYVERFHEQRPGITEDVLTHAFDGPTSPYRWAVEPVRDGPVLDLGCGSAPLEPSLSALGWVGVDRSVAEMLLARLRGDGRVTIADAASLPVATGSMAAVVSSSPSCRRGTR